MLTIMLPLLAESGLGAEDYAILTTVLAALAACLKIIELLVRKMIEKRTNGDGYHKHKRTDDTRQIAAEAKVVGSIEAKVQRIEEELPRVRDHQHRLSALFTAQQGETAKTTERLAKMEGRVESLGEDVREAKDAIKDGFSTVRESLGTIHRRIDDAFKGKKG